jgi:hypothetical protein
LPFIRKSFDEVKIFLLLRSLKNGDVAQLVEQRTENPCVTGSIPVITTKECAFLKHHEKRRQYIQV